MSEAIRGFAWFSVVACALAFVVLVFAGRSVFASEAGEHDAIVIRDEIHGRNHQLSGMIVVPSSCDSLLERVEAVDNDTYQIVFSTWHEPSVFCEAGAVPRPFEDTFFAPAQVEYTATLDGAVLPIRVLWAVTP